MYILAQIIILKTRTAINFTRFPQFIKHLNIAGEILADGIESISLQFFPPTQLPNGILESYRKFIEDALL